MFCERHGVYPTAGAASVNLPRAGPLRRWMHSSDICAPSLSGMTMAPSAISISMCAECLRLTYVLSRERGMGWCGIRGIWCDGRASIQMFLQGPGHSPAGVGQRGGGEHHERAREFVVGTDCQMTHPCAGKRCSWRWEWQFGFVVVPPPPCETAERGIWPHHKRNGKSQHCYTSSVLSLPRS